jgi:macrophage erythroblast attacher
MDYRPDISFEYDYIRIVYEVIQSNLRTNKKVVEKDLTTVVTRLQNAKKKGVASPEMLGLVKQLISKTEELERKYDQICKDEDLLYECLRERISQLQMIDGGNYTFENLKTFCTRKMGNLLLDFFLREKFLETAKNYIDEEKINVRYRG